MAISTTLLDDSVATSSVTTATVLTIDGTSLNNVTQNYTAAVEIWIAWEGAGTVYWGTARLTGTFTRTTGNLTVVDGSPEIIGGSGVSDVQLVGSGTDALVQVTTDDAASMTHHAWVVIRANSP